MSAKVRAMLLKQRARVEQAAAAAAAPKPDTSPQSSSSSKDGGPDLKSPSSAQASRNASVGDGGETSADAAGKMKHSKRRKRKHRDSPEHESRNTGDVPPAAASAAVAADNPGQKKRKISPIQVTPPPPKGGRKLSRLQEKMTKQLEGAQFRFLNEQLYTCPFPPSSPCVWVLCFSDAFVNFMHRLNI